VSGLALPLAAPQGGAVPGLPWIACALGILALLVSSTAGSLAAAGAAGFLGIWALSAAPQAFRAWRGAFRTPGLWFLPALLLATTLWSSHPSTTLRAAVQFALTAALAALAARSLPPRGFVSAALVSLFAGALLSLAFGRYVVDGLGGDLAFVGILASKNAFSFFMVLLAIFAAAALLDRGQPVAVRGIAVAAMLVSLPLMLLARSAGAVMSTVLALGILTATLVFARFTRAERTLLLTGAAVVAVPALGLVAMLAAAGTLGEAAADFIQDVLGKDMTLTGRTILWGHAALHIGDRPFGGAGYYAFWQQGSLAAEGIWRAFKIESRTGFHFHNMYVETAIAAGLGGAVLLAGLIWGTLWRALRRALDRRDPAEAALVAVMACLALRSFIEVDALFPFAIGTFMLFAAAAYGADHARDRRP